MNRKGEQKQHEGLKASEDIVPYLIANVYKQNKMEFYQNLDLKALETLISAAFEGKNISHQDKVFVVTLIKQHPYILSIAFSREKFNLTKILTFLRNDATIAIEKLQALEEMFLPFSKKFPEKVLGMLSKKSETKDLLVGHLYFKQIFKIIYTAIFCMHSTHISHFQSLIHQLMACLAKTIFSCQEKRVKPPKYLDSTEVVANFKDFLADLVLNLSTVELPLLLDLINLLDQQYLEQVLKMFDNSKNNKDSMQYCEFLIEILLNIMKIYESMKLNINKQYSSEDKKLVQSIQQKLLNNAIFLGQKIPYFIEMLLDKNRLTINSSSGEVIPIVGMVKYRTLQLIEKLLSINELQNIKIDFSRFDFFPVIELYLQRHKWNNIIHNLILKISQLLISQDYRHFKERYIDRKEEYVQNFFGNLIANFRNRRFFFLHSMRMTNNGNRCPIYQLSKMLVNQMKQQNDLSALIENFKVWKQFMESDLKHFETANFAEQKIPEREKSASPSKRRSRHRSFDITGSPIDFKDQSTRSLQTFEQILMRLKQEDKWSPKESPDNNRKKKIQNSLVRFDSMGLLESQIQP